MGILHPLSLAPWPLQGKCARVGEAVGSPRQGYGTSSGWSCSHGSTAPMGAPSCGCGTSTELGKPAEGNQPLPDGHRVDKAPLCPSMPRSVPGSEVAGHGCPWGRGHWRAGGSLGCGRPGAGWATLWGPLPLPCLPRQPPLGLPVDGLGAMALEQLCKCSQGFTMASCTSHRWDPASGPPPALLPASVSQSKSNGFLVSPWGAKGWEGTTERRNSLPQHPWAPPLALQVAPGWPGSNVSWPQSPCKGHEKVTALRCPSGNNL